MSKYSKAIAAVGAAVVSVAAVFGFDASSYVATAVSVVSAVLVYFVPNS